MRNLLALASRAFAAALMAAASLGCGKEIPMRMSAAGAPPIDREAPATLATATFALG
jgi:hypothetical protein